MEGASGIFVRMAEQSGTSNGVEFKTGTESFASLALKNIEIAKINSNGGTEVLIV